MNRIFTYLTVAFFCSISSAYLGAQTYQLDVFSRPYVPIDGGTPLVNNTWDDPEFVIQLGYDFLFFQEESGFLISPEFFLGGLFTTNLEIEALNLIAAFSVDLIDRGYERNEFLSPITFSTTGPVGSRVTILQYENAGFYSGIREDSIYVDFINFQLRLFEENNAIEVHIGPYSILEPDLDFEGSPGPVIGLIEDYDFFNDEVNGEVMLLDGNPLDPDIHTTFVDSYVDWPIPQGTVYRFTRIMTSVTPVDAADRGIFYYPNPSADVFYLHTSNKDNIQSPITILNAVGNTIQIDHETQSIDLSDQPAGIYFLKFMTAAGEVFQKVSLMK